jgi:2-keto-4-pentenoate hydratase
MQTVNDTAAVTAPSRTSAIAEQFVRARLEALSTPAYPGEMPETMETAYEVQEAAIALFPDQIVGWKVGGVPPSLQPSLGTHRVAGPIFSRNVWSVATEAPTPLPAIEGGFAAVEAEFIARIGTDADPEKMTWSLEEAAAQIDTVFIGVELAGSSLSSINDLGSAVVASDFGNNGGLIVGAELTDWKSRLDGISVETVINGESLGIGGSPSLAGGALESVRFLLEHCARRGRPLAKGTLISTGAVTGVHRVYEGDEARCAFAGIGDIHSVVVRATAAPVSS